MKQNKKALSAKEILLIILILFAVILTIFSMAYNHWLDYKGNERCIKRGFDSGYFLSSNHLVCSHKIFSQEQGYYFNKSHFII